MKLQGSGPSSPKTLQSKNHRQTRKRLSISRLDVIHGQRHIRLSDHPLGGNARARRACLFAGLPKAMPLEELFAPVDKALR
jgi:hypothetical protein